MATTGHQSLLMDTAGLTVAWNIILCLTGLFLMAWIQSRTWMAWTLVMMPALCLMVSRMNPFWLVACLETDRMVSETAVLFWLDRQATNQKQNRAGLCIRTMLIIRMDTEQAEQA